LKEDIASRKAYLEGERTMKQNFEAAIQEIVQLIQTKCNDGALKEEIKQKEVTYKLSLV